MKRSIMTHSRRSPGTSNCTLMFALALVFVTYNNNFADAFISVSNNHVCLSPSSSMKHVGSMKKVSSSPSLSSSVLTLKAEASTGPMIMESSASIYSGAGPISVDMNQYNLLNLEDIAQEWTAVLMAATPLQAEGVYLQAKSKNTVLADTVKVAFPRIPGKGLGLNLLELAGGRDDGLGITVIENTVPGGCADGSGILPGDSIIKVEVRKQKKTNNNASSLLVVEETEEYAAVGTECFGYDTTVEALSSLPPASSDDDDDDTTQTFVLTLKRLRRKPKVKLNLQYPPQMKEKDITLELFAGENLRRALLVRGVKLNDPLAKRFDSGGSGDCGAEGTCATCAVSIVRGQDLLNPPGSTESQIFQRQSTIRWRMSCKAIVGYGMKEGEITVRVNPKQWSD